MSRTTSKEIDVASDVKRAVRVGERLREEVARLLFSLRDPRLAGATVTRAELTDDLKLARVYVRPGEGIEPKDLVKGFIAASPRIRREVSEALKLRYSPEMKFFFDEGLDHQNRIEELLREIATDKER
jgi:ribosome-binding factor A